MSQKTDKDLMDVVRRTTRQIAVGSVLIGGGAPITVQTMAKCKTSEIDRVVRQLKKLEAIGCDIARVSVKDHNDAAAIGPIKRSVSMPIVADIHFDHRLAIAAIESGADKIRLNPGNIANRKELARVIASARERRIPIRIGVNAGSVSKKRRGPTQDEMINAVLAYVRVFETLRFYDIIISLKSHHAAATVNAYRRIAELCDYPLHVGVTAAGPSTESIIKSSIGIGALLLDGIGDTIRVSMTGSPEDEIRIGQGILSALKIRRFGPEIVSCPMCGRCQVDLVRIVREFKRQISALRITNHESRSTNHEASITVAIMGCEVNGPGEAKGADIGIAAGKGSGVLFKKGKAVRRIREKDFVKELIDAITERGRP